MQKQKQIKNRIINFFNEENGQATTEYVLMLTIAVSSFLILVKFIFKPVFKKLNEQLATRFDGVLTKSFHFFPLKR